MPSIGRAGRFIGFSCAVAVAAVAGVVMLQRTSLLPEHAGMQWSIVDRYCIDCHNSVERAGDVMFDRLRAGSVAEEAEIFETAVRKLRGRLMPPPGSPQPNQGQVDALISWRENSLDQGVGTAMAGHVPVQRLNRTEYANAVRDLLSVEIDPAEYLPAEVEV